MEDKADYAISGFRTTGLYPLDRQKVINKLTKANVSPSAHHLVSPMLIEKLLEMREASANKRGPARRGRYIHVSPGKSVAFGDIGAGPSGQQPKRTSAKRKLRMPEPDSEENLSSDEDMPEIPPEYAEEESSGKESEAEESEEEEPKEEGEENGRDEEGQKESKSKEIKEGLYVIVRFPGKKANSDYHFVGKVLGKEKSGDVPVKYFRRDCNVSEGEFYYFKEPQTEDIFPTEVTATVECLPNPSFIKNKLYFKASVMTGMVMR